MERRQVEELMMKLLIFETTDEDITIIVNYFKYQNKSFIIKDINNYFNTIIKVYCQRFKDKIMATIHNYNLKVDFNNIIIPRNDKQAIHQMIKGFKKDKTKLKDDLCIYLHYVETCIDIEKNISSVLGIRFIFDVLMNGDEEHEVIIIDFLNIIYAKSTREGKDILYRYFMREIMGSSKDKERLVQMLVKGNEERGLPGIVMYKSQELIIYNICVIKDNQKKTFVIHQDMTLYELFTLITIHFNINIDLFTLEIKDSERINPSQSMQTNPYKMISDLKLIDQNVEIKLVQINIEDPYYDENNKVKYDIESLINISLFNDEDTIKITSWFSYINNQEFHQKIKHSCIEEKSYDTFMILIEKKSDESLLFLNMVIGFTNGDIHRPYIRNIFPKELFRKKLIKGEDTKLKELVKDTCNYIKKDHFYCLLRKRQAKVDTIFEKNILFISIKELFETIFDKIYEIDLKSYSKKNDKLYESLYLFLKEYNDGSGYHKFKDYSFFSYPECIWGNKHFSNIWLNIIYVNLCIDSFNIINESLLTYFQDPQFNLHILRDHLFIITSIIHHNDYKISDSLRKIIVKYINENNLDLVFSQDILQFLLMLIDDNTDNNRSVNYIYLFNSISYDTQKNEKCASIIYLCKEFLSEEEFGRIITQLDKNERHYCFKGFEEKLDFSIENSPLNHIITLLYHSHLFHSKENTLKIFKKISLDDLIYFDNDEDLITLLDEYHLLRNKSNMNIYELIKEILQNQITSIDIDFYSYKNQAKDYKESPSELIVCEEEIDKIIKDSHLHLIGYIELFNENNEIISYIFQPNIMTDDVNQKIIIKEFSSDCIFHLRDKPPTPNKKFHCFYFYIKLKQ